MSETTGTQVEKTFEKMSSKEKALVGLNFILDGLESDQKLNRLEKHKFRTEMEEHIQQVNADNVDTINYYSDLETRRRENLKEK